MFRLSMMLGVLVGGLAVTAVPLVALTQTSASERPLANPSAPGVLTPNPPNGIDAALEPDRGSQRTGEILFEDDFQDGDIDGWTGAEPGMLGLIRGTTQHSL